MVSDFDFLINHINDNNAYFCRKEAYNSVREASMILELLYDY